MEQLEQEEAAAGSIIAVKNKKGKGKSTGRQTKLTSTAGVSTNSFKVTQPSPFAEAIDPVIPEFNAQPKKASGGRGRGKAAIKMEEDSKEGITKSPEKTAAAKAVRDAFGLSDDETPPPSLFERLKGKGKKQSQLKFQKKKPESSDDDDDDEPPPRKTAKRQKSGSDSEEEFGIPVPKKAAVKKSVSRKATTKPTKHKSSKPTSKVGSIRNHHFTASSRKCAPFEQTPSPLINPQVLT